MNRTIIVTGILFGTTAIILGAFGAHGLEKLLDADAITTFGTGVEYQMYHALLLLILGSIKQIPEVHKKLIFWLVTAGILFFSFSIYLLATNSLTGFDFKSIGFITPIGGLSLIAGWIVFGYRSFRHFN